MDIVLLTPMESSILPALELLPHHVTVLPCDGYRLPGRALNDAVLLDARRHRSRIRTFSRVLTSLSGGTPVIAVLTAGDLVDLSATWPVDDVVLDTASPAELDARLRLAVARHGSEASDSDPAAIRVGHLTIDETTHKARVRGTALELTYTEFELLKFLAQHPSRVFTRAQLLEQVWGYDHLGDSRTVDVHVHNLRAKLGPECEVFISTVRKVGYKFVLPTAAAQRDGRRRGHAEPAGRTRVTFFGDVAGRANLRSATRTARQPG